MDKPFNEYKFFKDYQIYCSYYKDNDTLFIKMIIHYKGIEIYNNNLYGDDLDKTEEIYNQECLLHQRNKKLEQLLNVNKRS